MSLFTSPAQTILTFCKLMSSHFTNIEFSGKFQRIGSVRDILKKRLWAKKLYWHSNKNRPNIGNIEVIKCLTTPEALIFKWNFYKKVGCLLKPYITRIRSQLWNRPKQKFYTKYPIGLSLWANGAVATQRMTQSELNLLTAFPEV